MRASFRAPPGPLVSILTRAAGRTCPISTATRLAGGAAGALPCSGRSHASTTRAIASCGARERTQRLHAAYSAPRPLGAISRSAAARSVLQRKGSALAAMPPRHARGTGSHAVNEGSESPRREKGAPSRSSTRGPKRKQPEEKPTRGKRSRVIAGAGDTPAAVDHPLHEDPYDEIEGNGTLLPARVLDSVIKIFCMHTEPNFSLPWQRKRQASSTSSGFAIPGRRILTNAHCIEYHTQVKVKRRGSDSKYVARVLAIGHECDTALLTVDDDEFWEGIEPVAFAEAGGGLPRLQDTVTVAGYPIGGDTMSVTSGVVSRIEVTSYVHGMSELLGVQIDAAINSGNSGGPAFNRQGECVGIAFQSLKDADTENLGYIIPVPVVRHFIQDYERNGKYTGFPILGIQWQKLENPDLRKSLGVSDKQGGVLVRQVDPTSTLAPHVKNGDILLSYDGTPIGQDGSVVFRSGERISFSYLVSQRYIGETAKLEVLSGGEVKRVSAKMAIPARLVPQHISDKLPSYFILAGLVFTRVTVPYLRSEYGKDYDYDAPVKLLDQMMHAVAEKADQQVVVLSQVLAHEINVGYEDIANTQVRKVNGEKVDNLAHLVDLVDGCKDKYLRLDLEYNQVVVLEAKAARKATEEILAMHGVPTDRSTDLE